MILAEDVRLGSILPELALGLPEDLLLRAIRTGPLRRSALKLADRVIYQVLQRSENPPGVKRDEWLALRSLAYSFERTISRGLLSDQAIRALLRFARNRLRRNPIREEFKRKYGDYPPGFLTISPGRSCNLNCRGCYAGTEANPNSLPYEVFSRILKEAQEMLGICFIVISGGEPFMYRSNDKGLLDLAEEYRDIYFLVYTNGTLITEDIAERMGRLGNLTPAISVEGGVATTERRRGEGVFSKVLKAFENLRKVGVPFGISVTATRENCDEILSDATIDFYFEEQGATYGWIFQYMPIGKNYDLNLMVTPEQRSRMQRRMWEVIEQRKVFLMDFWNSGTATHGCLAGGRQAGYFYINWNGDVTPCVFVPYAGCNIHEIYQRGGNLLDLIEVDFFAEIRKWQKSYGYKTRPAETKNLILPCIHRDHFATLQKLLKRYSPKPINDEAAAALVDPAYLKGLLTYGRACAAVLDPVWEEEYLGVQPGAQELVLTADGGEKA
jgi:MoaA/NifB/PqqE/SkfB family radical SAM enzyme